MATKDMIFEVLQRLIDYYHPKGFGEKQIDLYLEALEEYHINFIWDACDERMRRSGWFPRINELLSSIGQIMENCNGDPYATLRHQRLIALQEREAKLSPSHFDDPSFWETMARDYAALCSTRAVSCRKRAAA